MSTKQLQRRALLRAALVAGCAWCVPRAINAQAAGKATKAQVQYQDKPKGDQECAKCMHFVAADSSCQVVEGKVSPHGWCTLWAAKQGK